MASTQPPFIPVCARLVHKALCFVTSVILLLFASYASSQAIETVQHNSVGVSSAASVAVAFTGNVTSGNVILVAESSSSGVSLLAPTDSQSNSFAQLVTLVGTSGTPAAAIFAATAGASGADTVTCNISAANNIHCHIYEVQGITTTVDQTGSLQQASDSLTVSTSAATTNADDYVLAYFTDNFSAELDMAGTGWEDTELTDNIDGDTGFTEDMIVTSTGVQTATATTFVGDYDTPDSYTNVIVALKASGTATVATPTLSPASGIYGSAVNVTLADTTLGSTIYYTTNGSTPSTNSSVYSSPIAVSAAETLQAIAAASGYAQSAAASAAYTMGVAGTGVPILAVQHNSGSNETASSIAVPFNSNVTTGNVLLVAESTYDGETLETPTDSMGNSFAQLAIAGVNSSDTAVVAVYGATANGSGGDTVTCHISATNNIHCHIYEVQGVTAIVDKTGNDQLFVYSQAVSTSDATANPVDYLFGFFADNYQASTFTAGTGFGDTELSDSDGGDSAFSEDEVVIATGVQTATSSNAGGGNIYSPDGYYNIILALKATGTPTVPLPTFSPAAGTYATAQTVTISDSTVGSTIYYTTNGTTPTTNSPEYSSPIAVSAAETVMALATATGTGFAPSPAASATYSINPAATPTFSPTAGTYSTTQTVTISDSTGGASIYYTTDGSTPTTGSAGYSSAITVTATETIEAIATAAGQSNSAVGSAVYTIGTLAATPAFSPAGGVYTSAQSVTISDSTGGSTIYYTTNGTAPTTGSAMYSSAITVSASEKLEAIATANGYLQSAVGTAFYTISSSSTPILTVQHTSGSNEDASSLAVAFNRNVTSGNVLIVAESTYSGLTLETPTDSLGNTYTQLVTGTNSGGSVAAVYATTTTSSGADTVTCNTSAVNNIHCNIYEVQGITATVDQTGSFSETGTSLTVSTSAATTNADDYIFAFFADNDNGSNVTPGSGMADAELSNDGGDTGFSEDKVVVATGIQTATATSNLNDGFENVIVALKTTGTPTVSNPTLSPVSGTYTSVQNVTISDTTAGATIYYTTDGSTPSTGSAMYTTPISVSVTETVKAFAAEAGYASSQVSSAVYTINLPTATPTFSPGGGSYGSAQTVTISDASGSATIYYTTNGNTPNTGSTVYGGPISVSVWETLQAVAIAPGLSISNVGVASYTIGNGEAAAPTFSPEAGTYAASQTVSISDETAGATIYYTTDGTTPTTGSAVYSTAISVSASGTLEAIATAGGYGQSGVASAVYTINTTVGACAGMSVGRSVDGTANMNGFVPFQSATTGVVSLWNTNIANAAVDPNNAAIQSTSGYAGEATHINFGSSPGDGGIPFMIVDSGTTPKVSINVVDYAGNSDVVIAPYPNNVPIEGNAADCSGWPDIYQSDSHTNVLDRNTCWDYETYNTNRCNGLYDASEEAIWDMQNGNYRPWNWTSTDAAGLSVMAGLVKYDEAASGTINHAIRFTMQQSKNDANDGYFVEPASHSAGTSYGAPTVEGMRVRLKASFNTSGYSTIDHAILVALQQYGMIMADNGGYFFIQGATDPRWNDSDLAKLAGIPSSEFDVIDGTPGSTTMTPAYPGWDSVTAPTGPQPVINSFTASPQTVSAGTPVTFNFSVSGDSYDYIDMIGPVRLTQNGGGSGINTGSVTIYPTATQTYTLYAVNQYGNNGGGAGYGVTPSTPITIVVPGSAVVPPTFTPPPGPYTTAQVVTFNTTTYPFASFYYTTDGSTPTYPPTGTTIEYPQIPQPQSPESQGNVESITVSATETVNAIAVAPGYASASAVTSGVYQIGPVTATPTFSPAAGGYGLAQTVTISDATGGASIYYTTDGSTPTTSSSMYSAAITVSANETLEAIATSASANNSVVATAVYTIGGTAATPTFSPIPGSYAGTQMVTISDASSGSTIYYTVTAGTTGTTPTTNSSAYSGAISVTATSVVEAIAAGSGYTSSAPGSAAYTITAATPTFSPAAGSYAAAQTVTISDATGGVTIYYTTNGTTPTTSSPIYGSAITVSANETLEAIAASGTYASSVVGIATYNIEAALPTFSPTAGNYLNAQSVTISDTTPSSTIYYTTNGSTPTTNSAVYSAAVPVSATETLEAIASAPNYIPSAASSAAYTIGVATPTISPAGGSYTSIQTVTISDVTPSASIYYTTNGSTPTTSSSLYTGPVVASVPMTITAIATLPGYNQSPSASASYTYITPSPAAVYVQQCTGYQQYGSSVTCTFSTASTAGDTILIAYEGVAPNSVTSNIGTPVLLTTTNTIYAYALTNITAGTYTITANVTGNQRLWIAADEYTDVTSSPIDASASGYNSGSYVSSVVSSNFNTTAASDMLWAVCFTGYAMNPGTAPITWTALPTDTLGSDGVMTLENGVAGAAGTYYGECTSGGVPTPEIVTVALLGTPPSASAPSFSPAAGTYTSTQYVTISSTVPSASYYYTTDGTTPTTSSTLYSTPITIASSETLKAITVASGYNNSTVSSAAYTINLPPAAMPTFSPTAGNYATAQTVTISDSDSSPTIYYTTNGTTPTTASTHYTAPITVSATTETVEAVAIAPGYSVSPTGTAVYTIGNPVATPMFSPAAGTYTTIQSVTISDSTGSSTIYYTTNGATPTTVSTMYSSAITVSASETINAIATAAGYVQSNLASAAYTINLPTAATPIFSPAAGTYGAAQSVVIASTTPSATIYYTTNGTAPTTSSSVYSSAVSVSSTQTLEAIATATGYNPSAAGSAAYTISASGGSAPTFVQSCNNYINYTENITCALSSSVTAGDALMIGFDLSGASTISSVTAYYTTNGTTPTTSSTLHTAATAVVSNLVYGQLYSYIVPNVVAGKYLISVNTSSNIKIGLEVNDYTNINSSPVDQTASGSSSAYSTSLNSNTFSTSSANELLWASCYGANATPAVGTAPITWTARTTDGSSPSGSGIIMFIEDGPTTAAGSYYGQCDFPGGASDPNMITVSLVGASTPTVATPTFSPGTDTYTSDQTVTISDATGSSTIYYTTNGTAPTTTSSVYSTPIPVSASETLEAFATAAGDSNSSVGIAEYVINLTPAATPSFTPAAGTYTSVQTVTISSTTPSATIYYTTNGSTPTTASLLSGSSPVSVSVSATQTLEAIAVAAGYSNSTVQSGVYNINLPAAMPTFSPGAGSYSTVQTVTISDATGSATIYYTTNGSTPSTASAVYSGPITVPAPETLEAVAIANGYSLSTVGSAAYTYPIPAAGASYVQQCNAYLHSSGGTSNSCQLTGITAGDTIVIGVWTTAATLSSVTASTGTPVAEISDYASPNEYYSNGYLSAYILSNTAAGSNTFTVNTPSDYTDTYISAVEFSGVAASPYDAQGTGTLHNYGADVYGTTSTFNTTAANDMLWTLCDDANGQTLAVGNAPITWTSVTNVTGNGAQLLTEYGAAGAAGSYYGDCEKLTSGYGLDIETLALKSAVATASTPTFSPAAGSYATAQTVTISTTTPSSTIYYTTDGSTPTTSSTAYSTPITVSSYETVEAIAVSSGYANSPVGSAAYSIGVAIPTFSPVGGTYSTVQTVTISDATGGASIYYTTNGTAPTTGSTPYSTPINVSVSQTLEALAVKTSYSNSAVASAAYTINLTTATPTFSPAAGTYNSAQTVTISDATGGATIYYTTNGSAPTTSSPTYSVPISVSATETLEALATYPGDANSAVGTAVYTLQVVTPAFSPGAGSYSTDQSVTISDATGSATIYYTTNGSAPTTSSSIYSSPVPVTSAQTLEAIGVLAGYTNSATASAAYTFPPPSSNPTYVQQCNAYLHSSGGTTNSCQLTGITAGDTIVIGIWTTSSTLASVTASTGTPVAEISNYTSSQEYYSNGYSSAYILPNAASGSNTFTVTTPSYYTDTYIQAVEFTGTAASPYDGSGTGTLRNYGADIYATTSTFNTTAANDTLWTMCEYTPGTTFAVGNAPVTWTSVTNYAGNGAQLFTEYGAAGAAGSYYGDCEKTDAGYGPDIIALALKSAGPPAASTPTFSPTAGSYATAQTVTISTTTPSSTIYYTTDGTTPTTGSTAYSTPISVAAWETVSAIAVSSGYTNSAVGSAAYSIGVATPTFSPGTGSYTTVQTVTISDTTGGASIYYTTNGTTPTSSSMYYSAPITVSATETVEAIGVKTSYANSAVGSAAYTLQLPQTIIFTPSSPVTYGVSPISLSATGGSSGEPVTYTYVSGPGTLSGTNNDILTITGVGTVMVTANQAGNSSYAAATPVTASIVVHPAVLTVTANNLSKAQGAANPTLTVSYSGFQYSDGTGVLSGAPAISTTATTASGAGTYPITVTQGTLSAANYTFAFVNGTLSVVAAPTVVISTSATVSGSHSGGYSVAVTVTNSGTGAASNVTLTSATLGTTNGTIQPPATVASIAANSSYTFTVTFPGSVGPDGAGVAEKYSGTYTGGSFSASVRSVTLP